ncbi:MAG: hypothetical protein IKM39_04645, partial [Clostridia bacterium]|nr:hypothetical protein [Clostridia bacterium]
MKRICSFLLVFVLITTFFTGIPVQGDTYYSGSNAIAWDQRNSAWSGNVYGTGTIYDTACGVLSTCNAINYLHGSFNTTEKAKAFVL